MLKCSMPITALISRYMPIPEKVLKPEIKHTDPPARTAIQKVLAGYDPRPPTIGDSALRRAQSGITRRRIVNTLFPPCAWCWIWRGCAVALLCYLFIS